MKCQQLPVMTTYKGSVTNCEIILNYNIYGHTRSWSSTVLCATLGLICFIPAAFKEIKAERPASICSLSYFGSWKLEKQWTTLGRAFLWRLNLSSHFLGSFLFPLLLYCGILQQKPELNYCKVSATRNGSNVFNRICHYKSLMSCPYTEIFEKHMYAS